MNSDTQYYRRNLPHFQHPSAMYSIVFRLDGSLPSEVVLRLTEERIQQENAAKSGRNNAEVKIRLASLREEYFRKFDSILNGASSGPHWLKDDAVAQITADAIHYLNGSRYTLIAYCIMPNHVHLIVALDDKSDSGSSRYKIPFVLTSILHSLKRHTARESNRILQRSGAFWQHESYDHIIRDADELRRTVEYVMNNPVSAGCVAHPDDWKWTYVNTEWLEKNV